MESQFQMKPAYAIAMAAAIILFVVAPLWAFFNVTIPFPPMLGDDEAVTTADTPVEIKLIANDADADGHIDTSTVMILTQPKHGVVEVSPATAVCTYSPAQGFTGVDQFSYQLKDDEGVSSNIGLVSVTVQPAAK
jgi:hypothetical protein